MKRRRTGEREREREVGRQQPAQTRPISSYLLRHGKLTTLPIAQLDLSALNVNEN